MSDGKVKKSREQQDPGGTKVLGWEVLPVEDF